MNKHLPVLFLHGFSQSAESWELVIAHLQAQHGKILTPDIRGHGVARKKRPITFTTCSEDICELLQGEPCLLVGYSLGGRLALQFATRFPHLVKGLVLVSTTPGIKDPAERVQRTLADTQLARRLAQISIEQFAREWLAQPLFVRDSENVKSQTNSYRLEQTPADLAVALTGLTVGKMQPLWSYLPTFSFPVRILVGEHDHKFVKVAFAAESLLQHGSVEVVAGCGHSLHIEAAQHIAQAVDGLAGSD